MLVTVNVLEAADTAKTIFTARARLFMLSSWSDMKEKSGEEGELGRVAKAAALTLS